MGRDSGIANHDRGYIPARKSSTRERPPFDVLAVRSQSGTHPRRTRVHQPVLYSSEAAECLSRWLGTCVVRRKIGRQCSLRALGSQLFIFCAERCSSADVFLHSAGARPGGKLYASVCELSRRKRTRTGGLRKSHLSKMKM